MLTSAQMCDVAFSSVRRAEARLQLLYELRVVDRFRPHQWPGSAPYHWVLDQAGANVIAAERGVDVKSLAWRHERAMALASSSMLRHRVGCNGVFAALLREARYRLDCKLVAWWSASRCAEEWGDLARPDGYGVWQENGVRVPFILEYDRGTESGERLADKLGGYSDLLRLAVSPTWVLFYFERVRREVAARRTLAEAPVPLATASPRPDQSPRDPIWLPIGGDQRLGLAALLAVHPADQER